MDLHHFAAGGLQFHENVQGPSWMHNAALPPEYMDSGQQRLSATGSDSSENDKQSVDGRSYASHPRGSLSTRHLAGGLSTSPRRTCPTCRSRGLYLVVLCTANSQQALLNLWGISIVSLRRSEYHHVSSSVDKSFLN